MCSPNKRLQLIRRAVVNHSELISVFESFSRDLASSVIRARRTAEP